MKHRTGTRTLRWRFGLALLLVLMLGMNVAALAADTMTIDVDGTSTEVYEVSGGFYQDGATYAASTNFYITSKAGLEYFRNLVSASDDGANIGDYAAAWVSASTTAVSFYTNNIFTGKTVHLLADIDLNNEDWIPIGYTNTAFNSGDSKTHFYGSFNGHGHKISNLKIVGSSSNLFKSSYGAYGLFGMLGSRAGQTFSNLTIENVSGVTDTSTYDYVGAFVGNAGTNAVSFENCHVTGTIDLSSSYQVGGIYGIGSGTMSNCSTKCSGTIASSAYYAAGLAGCARAGVTVSGCEVSGVKIDAARAGGLLGLNNNDATFENNSIEGATISGTETAGFNDCMDTRAATTSAETVTNNVTIPITGISITGDSSTLFAGETLQLTASPIPETTTETLGEVTWSSSAESIATVNDSGLVTPVSAGSAKISATVGDLTKAYTVKVQPVASQGSGSTITIPYMTFDDLAQAWGATYAAGTVTLQKDISLESSNRLNIDKDVTIDLNGYTISGTNSYVIYIRNNSKVTLQTKEDNPTAGGVTGSGTYGVYVASDSELTITGGSYTASTYAVANTGKTTISGGDFTTTSGSYTINNYNGILLKITGGTFNKNTANYGTQEITGGYFGVKPNETYVATGYGVVYDDDTSMYHVVPADQVPVPVAKVIDTDGTTVVGSYDTLAEAIGVATEGQTISLNEGTFAFPATAVIKNGVTLEGAGVNKTTLMTTSDGATIVNKDVTIKSVYIDGKAAATTADYKGCVNLCGDGACLENCVIYGGGTGTWGASVYIKLQSGETASVIDTSISGGFRAIFLGSQSGSAVVDGCTLFPGAYPINVDGGGDFSLNVKNTTLKGWTSFSPIKEATFTDCTFEEGAYDFLRPYSNTTLIGCTFDSEFRFDPDGSDTVGLTHVMRDCYVMSEDKQSRTLVTDANYSSIIDDATVAYTLNANIATVGTASYIAGEMDDAMTAARGTNNDFATNHLFYVDPTEQLTDEEKETYAAVSNDPTAEYPYATYTINAIIQPSVTITGWDYNTYDSSKNGPTVDGNPGSGEVTFTYYTDENYSTKTTAENSGAASEGGRPENVGTYYVEASIAQTAHYCAGTAKADFTISKADVSLTAPTANDPGYNGQAQALVTAGSTDDGKLYYALGTETAAPEADAESTPEEQCNWKTTVPNGTDAGTYYVWYKVVGDSNHNDTVPACVTSTIRVPISAKVTFKVVNGSWDEGEGDAATADQGVTLEGYEGDKLKLTADQIPAVGSRPDENFRAGAWDVEPDTEREITTDTVYTYTYEAKTEWEPKDQTIGDNDQIEYDSGSLSIEVFGTADMDDLSSLAMADEQQAAAGSVSLSDIADVNTLSEIVNEAIANTESAGHVENDVTSIGIVLVSEVMGQDTSGAVPTITYEVHPEAIAYRGETAIGSAVITNDQLKPDAVFIFRLGVPDALVIGDGDKHHVKVTHKFSDGTEEESTEEIKGTAGGYYVDLTASSFSEFELEAVTVTVEGRCKVSKSLSLAEEFKINLYVKDITGDPADYEITYGSTTKKVSEGEEVNGKYKFMIGSFSSKQMTNTVNVTIKYDDTVIYTLEDYSIRQYCLNMIGKSNSEKFLALCRATLDYGTCAQQYFDNATSGLANEGGYGAGDDAIDAAVVPEDFKEPENNRVRADGVTKITSSLNLESRVELNFFFYGYEGTLDNTTVTVTGASGSDVAYEKLNGKVRVTIKNIPSNKLSDWYTVSVGNSSLSYSPMTYAYKHQGDGNALARLCKALYLYATKAHDYFTTT